MSIMSISDKTVEHIRWGMIPPSEHLDLLANIEVGHCVYSLPVQVPDEARYVVFSSPPDPKCLALYHHRWRETKARFKRVVYICQGLAIDVWERVA